MAQYPGEEPVWAVVKRFNIIARWDYFQGNLELVEYFDADLRESNDNGDLVIPNGFGVDIFPVAEPNYLILGSQSSNIEGGPFGKPFSDSSSITEQL